MVNRDRLVNEFIELARIDSLTFKERKMADELKRKIGNMNLFAYEDGAGEKIGGDSGNVICTVPGNKNVPSILITAHMDTVIPGIGKNPVIEGNMIRSDGKTILGADDIAGIASILEVLRVIDERDLKHGDITIAFTVAEESGLWGAKNLDYNKIKAKYGFVMDSDGKVGKATIKAPTQNHFNIVIKGKSAHAGMEPEKGVSAIQIAAKAISEMKLGRIDEETTANIGIIHGGLATNIVTDRVEIEAEARSRDTAKLVAQTNHMKECFEKAAEEFGGSVEFSSELMYPAFNIEKNAAIIRILEKASESAGIELILEATGGGSDTNIINGKGIEAVDLSIGVEKLHSVEEQICIDELVKSAEFLISIIQSIE